jgi:hypothetical protein
MIAATMPPAPKRKLRVDRVLLTLVVLGGGAFAAWWFGLR